MSMPLKEYEGVWEDVLTHADEFAGQKVRVTVLPPVESVEVRNQRILAVLDEMDRNPLTAEEMAILDGYEQFEKDRRCRLLKIEDAA